MNRLSIELEDCETNEGLDQETAALVDAVTIMDKLRSECPTEGRVFIGRIRSRIMQRIR